MKKLLTAVLSLTVLLSATSAVIIQPSVEAATKKKESTYQEKMAYYNKQIKKIKGLIATLQAKRKHLETSSAAYRASLTKEDEYLGQLIYYYTLISKLNQ
ncbi:MULTISPECIES: hypothetical protein [unclassified Paenibacillus]|uniref:hypothetical protein n=1 Tax=unclassified Paenibacillus TaxID=185978 RepID=UPI000FE1EF66|nr:MULTISPECIES: hypothetical protein [unclassified Paenibacillus]MCM3174468.1 hypothetical protein [Paenibacillus sp. MER 99-2]